VPAYRDVRLMPCPEPPSKMMLVVMAEKAAQKAGKKKLGVDPEKGLYPDQAWLLAVLSTLEPANEIFLKHYVPPVVPPVTKKDKPRVDNHDGFYTGLP